MLNSSLDACALSPIPPAFVSSLFSSSFNSVSILFISESRCVKFGCLYNVPANDKFED